MIEEGPGHCRYQKEKHKIEYNRL